MESKEAINKHIASIKDNEVKLYSYLYDLVDKPLSEDECFLEDLYCGFLKDSRSEIRRISIYALLFFLKIRKEQYKSTALQWIKDPDNSEGLRLFCMAGIGAAYMGSKDAQLLSFFYDIFTNSSNDEDIRAESFTVMLNIVGLSTLDILRKNNNKLVFSFNDIYFDNFVDEFEIINRLMN